MLGGQEGEYRKLKFGTQYTASYGAEASLSLVNVSNWRNTQSASYGEQASQFQRKDRELSVREQIITFYYFSLLSREAIVLNQELVNSADSLLKAAAVRLENGLVEPLEYNRVKALYLETVSQLRESEGAYKKNLNALQSLVGVKSADTLVLTEKLNAAIQNGSGTSLELNYQQLPRYKMLTARRLQSQADLKKQQAKIFPEVSLYGRVSRQSFSDEVKFNEWFDIAVVGLRAEWNIFTGFNRQSTIHQSSLQLQQAQWEQENYSLQAEKELQELTINHQVAAHGLNRFTEHYTINLANHKIAGEKYTQGIYSIDQYVTIYQEMVRSQNQYLTKLANYLVYESMVQSRNLLNQ